jgi:hypothetical protein
LSIGSLLIIDFANTYIAVGSPGGEMLNINVNRLCLMTAPGQEGKSKRVKTDTFLFEGVGV